MSKEEIVAAITSAASDVAQAGFSIFGSAIAAIAPYAIGVGILTGVVF